MTIYVYTDDRHTGKRYFKKKKENIIHAVGEDKWYRYTNLLQKNALVNWYDKYYDIKGKHPIISTIYNAYCLIIDGDLHPEFYPG